jgi:hypothetical protein
MERAVGPKTTPPTPATIHYCFEYLFNLGVTAVGSTVLERFPLSNGLLLFWGRGPSFWGARVLETIIKFTTLPPTFRVVGVSYEP